MTKKGELLFICMSLLSAKGLIPICFTFLGMVNLLKSHLAKAKSPIVYKLSGIFIFLSFLQPQKASFPITLRELDKMTCVSESQFLKAVLLTKRTVLGSLILDSLGQLLRHPASITCMLFGKVRSFLRHKIFHPEKTRAFLLHVFFLLISQRIQTLKYTLKILAKSMRITMRTIVFLLNHFLLCLAVMIQSNSQT